MGKKTKIFSSLLIVLFVVLGAWLFYVAWKKVADLNRSSMHNEKVELTDKQKAEVEKNQKAEDEQKAEEQREAEEKQNREMAEKKKRELNHNICKIIESKDSSKCLSFRDSTEDYIKNYSAEKECLVSFLYINYLPNMLKNRQCDASFCSDSLVLDTIPFSKSECDDLCGNLGNCSLIQNENVRSNCKAISSGENDCEQADSPCQDGFSAFNAIKNSDSSKLDSMIQKEDLSTYQIRRVLSGKSCDDYFKEF